MGAGEIARRLGLSRQRVQQLSERDDWPDPYDELAMGRVWLIADIEAWITRQRSEIAAPDADFIRDPPAGPPASRTDGSAPPAAVPPRPANVRKPPT